MVVKVAFGRCALPHIGHAAMINDEVDFFILSNNKNLPSTANRLALLCRLGAPSEKIIIGNPYKELTNLKKKYGDKLLVVTELENEALPKYLGIATELFTRKLKISSTKLRKLIGFSFDTFAEFYLNDKISILLAFACLWS